MTRTIFMFLSLTDDRGDNVGSIKLVDGEVVVGSDDPSLHALAGLGLLPRHFSILTAESRIWIEDHGSGTIAIDQGRIPLIPHRMFEIRKDEIIRVGSRLSANVTQAGADDQVESLSDVASTVNDEELRETDTLPYGDEVCSQLYTGSFSPVVQEPELVTTQLLPRVDLPQIGRPCIDAAVSDVSCGPPPDPVAQGCEDHALPSISQDSSPFDILLSRRPTRMSEKIPSASPETPVAKRQKTTPLIENRSLASTSNRSGKPKLLLASGIEMKKSSHFQVANDWQGQVDGFVASEIKRTMNFLIAISRGIAILSADCVKECSASLDVEDRQLWLVDKEGETKWGFTLEDSVHRARLRKVLDGVSFWVHGKLPVSTEELKILITSMGGLWLPRAPAEPSDKTICLSESLQKKADFKVVKLEWLLEVAMKQEIQ